MTKKRIFKVSKVIMLTVSMMTVLAFTGCGKNEQKKEAVITAEATTDITTVEKTTVAETETDTKAEVTTKEVSKGLPPMSDLYNEIAKKAEIGSMYQVSGEDLLDSYGIDVSGCKDYVFYQADTAPSADTVALFHCKDTASAESVKEGLEVFLDNLLVTNEDYAPEEYAKASKAKVTCKDNFVYLIVCDKLSQAEKVVEQY